MYYYLGGLTLIWRFEIQQVTSSKASWDDWASVYILATNISSGPDLMASFLFSPKQTFTIA